MSSTTQRRRLGGVGGAPMWVGQALIAVAVAIIAVASVWLVGRDGDEDEDPLQPDEVAYAGFMSSELEVLNLQLTETGYLLQQPDMSSPDWRAGVARGAEAIRASAAFIEEREGVGRFTESDKAVDEAMEKYIEAMAMVEQALSTEDEALIGRAFDEMLETGELLSRANTGAD